eukprot:s3798_g4.t1
MARLKPVAVGLQRQRDMGPIEAWAEAVRREKSSSSPMDTTIDLATDEVRAVHFPREQQSELIRYAQLEWVPRLPYIASPRFFYSKGTKGMLIPFKRSSKTQRRVAWVSPEFRALHPHAAGWIDAAPYPWIIMADKAAFVESRQLLRAGKAIQNGCIPGDCVRVRTRAKGGSGTMVHWVNLGNGYY